MCDQSRMSCTRKLQSMLYAAVKSKVAVAETDGGCQESHDDAGPEVHAPNASRIFLCCENWRKWHRAIASYHKNPPCRYRPHRDGLQTRRACQR